eukprot:4352677-Ditylum_brightwellii.AAC.1
MRRNANHADTNKTATTKKEEEIMFRIISDEEEEYIEGGIGFDNYSLSAGSVSNEELVKDQHSEKLPLYPICEATKDKNAFCIDNVIEEENKVFDYKLDVDADELKDLHSSCVLSKKIQNKLREEEEVAMDDPW